MMDYAYLLKYIIVGDMGKFIIFNLSLYVNYSNIYLLLPDL